MSIQVEIQRASKQLKQPSDEDFQRWAELVLQMRRPAAQLVIRVVDEDEIRQLNRDFRGKDKSTNVLSFPYEKPETGPASGLQPDYLGDLVICAPVVESEALLQLKTSAAHWAHMVIHGILHLLGYDHIFQSDADAMEALEIELLAQLGVANPYEITE